MSNIHESVKVLVVGDSGVGKTSLVKLLCHGQPFHNPPWTVGCSIEVMLHEYRAGTPDKQTFFVELWDIGGSNSHRSSASIFYSGCQGIIFVYDVTNRKSLNNLQSWMLDVTTKNISRRRRNSRSSTSPARSLPGNHVVHFMIRKGVLEHQSVDISDSEQTYQTIDVPMLFVGTKHDTTRTDYVQPMSVFRSKEWNSLDLDESNCVALDCTNANSMSAAMVNKSLAVLEKQITVKLGAEHLEQAVGVPLKTYLLELAGDYSRIVFDLEAPLNRICAVLSDGQRETRLNDWSVGRQNTAELVNNLHKLVDVSKGDMDVDDNETCLHEDKTRLDRLCTVALSVLMEPMSAEEKFISQSTDTKEAADDRYRIMILTALDAGRQTLIEFCQLVASSFATGQLARFSELSVELVILIGLSADELRQSECDNPSCVRALEELRCGNVVVRLHMIDTSLKISEVSVPLVSQHYDLVSSIVTAIPMKEEQNVGSTANYNVEILHKREIHGNVAPAWPVHLRWSSPKSAAPDPFCTSVASRFTPVDVQSRPSACLTNFLMAGKVVLVEVEPTDSGKPSSGKTSSGKPSSGSSTSHMLMTHGKNLFIHRFNGNYSIPCNGPIPPITEQVGGLVPDYRIKDFRAVVELRQLAPRPFHENDSASSIPMNVALAEADLSTRFFPLAVSDSILSTIADRLKLKPLYPPFLVLAETVIYKAELDAAESVLKRLLAMENRSSSKPLKLTDQYRQLWMDVEQMLSLYAHLSSSHRKLLATYIELKRAQHGTTPEALIEKYQGRLDAFPLNKPADNQPLAGAGIPALKRVKTDPSLRRGSKAQNDDSDNLSELSRSSRTPLGTPQRTPQPNEPIVCEFKEKHFSVVDTSMTLLQLWLHNQQLAIESDVGRKKEFMARLNSKDPIVQLYPELGGEGVPDRERDQS